MSPKPWQRTSQVWMFYDRRKRHIVLAWRGTQSMKNWGTDFSLWPSKFPVRNLLMN